MKNYGVKFQINFCTKNNFEEQSLQSFSCHVNENKGSVKNDICEIDGFCGIGHCLEHDIMVKDGGGTGRGRNLF